MTLKQLQDHANLLSRYAKQLHDQMAADNQAPAGQAADPPPPTPAALLKESLELLTSLQELNPTVERESLLGSLYKRRAQVTGNVSPNLKQAAKYYKQAYDHALRKDGELNPYPALNWLTLEVLLTTLAKPKGKAGKRAAATTTEIGQEFKKVLEVADKLQKDDDVWKRLHLPDALLLHHLLQGDLGKNVPALLKAYDTALGGKADVKTLDSVTGQFDFLAEMLERGPGTHTADIKALLELKNALKQKH